MQFHYVYFRCLLFFIFFCSVNAKAQGGRGVGLHPRITYISQSQTKDVGGTAYFSCHSANAGRNTVTWLKGKGDPSQAEIVIAIGDKVVVTPEEEGRIIVRNIGKIHTLQIKGVGTEDTGVYHCELTHNVRASTELYLRSSPRLTIDRPIFGATLGQDTTLECLAIGNPAPVIKWMKGAVVVENDDHYGISQTTTGVDNFTNATLYIKSIQLEHFGVYVCKAENKIGSSIDGRIAVLQNVFQDYRGSISSDRKSRTFAVPKGFNPKFPKQLTETDISISPGTPASTMESYNRDASFVLKTTT